MKDLDGRVAVITGGASGIGLGMARRLAKEGMKIVLADIEPRALGSAVQSLGGEGAGVIGVETDVSKPDSVQALATRTLDAFGKVHIVCNNAGVAVAGATWEHSLEDWKWVLGVNLWGVVHGIRTFVPIMIEQGEGGHVVNTASMAGLLSGPFMGVYGVTKHAVVMMTEALHHELAVRGEKVRASVLCPAWVATKITDSERNRPDDLPAAQEELSAQEQMMQEMARSAIENGLSPDVVAERVLEAIRDDKFWILTHPEWKDAVKARMTAILEEKNPELFFQA